MSFLQKFNIDSLATNFTAILQLLQDIQTTKREIGEKLNSLKEIYNKLIKENNKKIFLFCLDSFYFQYKILIIEMENINRFISLINNRMYGDYYKLYNIIIIQCGQFNIDTREIASDAKKYPTYRDLEPFHEYDLEHIIGLHADILTVLSQLYIHYSNKEQSIHGYNDTANVGISIVNFINTLEYENTLLREQVSLYVNYMTFFHNSQLTYLKNLFTKIRLFYKEIEDDIMNNNSKISLGTTRLTTQANFSQFQKNQQQNMGSSLDNNGLYNILQSTQPNAFLSLNTRVSAPLTTDVLSREVVTNEVVTNDVTTNEVVTNDLHDIISEIQTPLETIIQDAENMLVQGDRLISKIETNTMVNTDSN